MTTPSFVFNPIAVDPNCKSKKKRQHKHHFRGENPQIRGMVSQSVGVCFCVLQEFVIEQFPTQCSDLRLF
jgi:hypothetical protein